MERCSWIHRINIIKIATLPKAINIFNAISINIPKLFFPDLESTLLKFIAENKTHTIASLVD